MPKSQPLEYQSSDPPFLRRLKANNLSQDGRHNVQIPRARGNGVGGVNDRLNMKGEEGEDEPIVVDEEGNVVSLDEIQGRDTGSGDSKWSGDGDEKGKAGDDEVENTRGLEKERVEEKVTSGFGKKRKVGKVVGENGGDHADPEQKVDDDGNASEEPLKSLEESTKDLKSVVGKGKEDAKKEESGKKTKRKKIKLSFDEPE